MVNIQRPTDGRRNEDEEVVNMFIDYIYNHTESTVRTGWVMIVIPSAVQVFKKPSLYRLRRHRRRYLMGWMEEEEDRILLHFR